MSRPAEPFQSPRLLHCITLALLLHIWLVLVVGNAPSGTAKPGDGVWGSLNVTLREPRVDPDKGSGALSAPTRSATPANAGPLGSGRQERFGGAVRPISAPTDLPKTPGAARLGAWNDTPVAAPAPVSVPAKPLEAMPAESPPPPRLLALDAALEPTLARLSRPALTPSVLTAPLAPLERLPQRESVKAAPVQAAPESPPAAAPPLNPAGAANPVPTPTPTPTPPAPLFAAPISQESIELRPALPSVLAPMLVPALTSVPQQLAAQPIGPAPDSPRIAAPERLPAVDFERQTDPEPSAAPAAQAQPTPTPTPTPAPTKAAAAKPAVVASTPSGPAATAPVAAATTSSPAPASLKPTAVDPGLLGLVAGVPDAGPRVGQDVATPPSASASAPRLNLQWVPPRGAELSSRGSRGVLQLLPVPPEHKSKWAEEMEKAGKADCRKAYGGAGLLAVLPLALDAVGNNGCQW